MEYFCNRTPDFDQLAAVLRHEKPDRTTLFEFYLSDRLYCRANGNATLPTDPVAKQLFIANAMAIYGYDFCMSTGCPLVFINGPLHKKQTRSLNENRLIYDWESFEAYPWPNPDIIDYSVLELVRNQLPGNMKLMFSSAGILETATEMLGYENLCYLIYDEPELVRAVFDRIGSLHISHYQHALEHDSVGMLMANDDWGFNTQTLLSPDLLRELVFPWYKKVVSMAHDCGRPAVLHSCGCLTTVMDDIIHDMKFDGKHSYQDSILPVEYAYDRWGKDIAILGGLDMDYLARRTPAEITQRSRAMVTCSEKYNGYALGSGNSIAEFIPDENYFAMLEAAR